MHIFARNWKGEQYEVLEYEHVITDTCHGVLFTRRGKDDPHVMFTIITEDDESWFVSTVDPSSFWTKRLIKVLQEAQEWMEENCEPDIDKDGHQWGYKFRS